MSFEIATQTVIYTLLTGHAPLVAIVKGIYDDVPQDPTKLQDAKFPYVTIGESTHNEFDTDLSVGDDTTTTVHVWSRGRGRDETKKIQGEIYNALHRKTPTYAGFDILGIDWQDSRTLLDSDGKTRHGVQTFRLILRKV